MFPVIGQDLTKFMHTDENNIRIEVINTLADQLRNIKNPFFDGNKFEDPSGIVGKVELYFEY